MEALTRDVASTELTANRERFGASVYTPLEEAIVTLRQRQARGWARAEQTALGATVPEPLRGPGPIAVLFRQVGSANYETRRVVRLAEEHGLRLVIFEYHADRFLTRNRDKYSLGRPGFYGGLGRNGGRRVEYIPLFDLDAENGSPFHAIKTFRGEALIDFHHRLLAAECPSLSGDALFDASQWFTAQGTGARGYYPAFISLFLRHAILFETFVLHAAECEFTRDVFLPAFDKIKAETDIKPLIVPAEREDWEGDEFWQLYPERLQRHVGPYRVRDREADSNGIQWETPAERERISMPLATSVSARPKANLVAVIP